MKYFKLTFIALVLITMLTSFTNKESDLKIEKQDNSITSYSNGFDEEGQDPNLFNE